MILKESPINNLTIFIQPKWAIASRTPGSGNTGHIGSPREIADLVTGNGSFETEKEFWDDIKRFKDLYNRT